MARARGKSVVKRPRKKFTGINVLNTAVDLYQANAFTQLFTNQGIFGTFVAPLMDSSNKFSTIGGKVDGALDIKEITALLAGDDGGMIQSSRVTGGTGAVSLGKAITDNMAQNAFPVALKIIGSNVVKKLIKKTGAARSMNKLARTAQVSDLVRF